MLYYKLDSEIKAGYASACSDAQFCKDMMEKCEKANRHEGRKEYEKQFLKHLRQSQIYYDELVKRKLV
jgi:hypothetical protein